MAEQNDGQEWDESDESGNERNTNQMENQQSDQQMATMAGGGQLNLSGPSQLGGGNIQNINPTFNDRSNSNNVVYNNCTFVLNNDNYTEMSHSFQGEGGQQPPRLSDNPPLGKLTEQCLQHMHNRIQRQSSGTGSRCPTCGSPTLPDQSPPTPSQPVATGSSQTPAPTPSSCSQGQSQMKQINDGIVRSRLASSQPVSSRPCSTDSRQDIRPQADQKRGSNQLASKKQQRLSKTKQRTDEQSKSQLPRCSLSTQTNAALAIETKGIQATPPNSVTDSTTLNRKLSSRRAIVDSFGDKLKPGDCVRVQLDRRSVHWGVYLGGFEMVHFDKNTQEVKIEMMDMIKDSQNFTRRTIISNMHMTNISHTCYRLQPSSSAQCKIFPAKTRLDRARSCVGKVSPVRETWCGADFVSWIFTGLNWDQAGKKGFELCY